MDEVLSQAPNVNIDIVKEVFEKHNKEVLPTLMELWDIKETQKVQSNWDNIRDTCDAFDKEMQNMLVRARTNKD